MPKSSDALRIGTPSMAIPFGFIFFQMHIDFMRAAVPLHHHPDMGFLPVKLDDFAVLAARGAILSYPRDIKPREYSSFPGHCRHREYSFRG